MVSRYNVIGKKSFNVFFKERKNFNVIIISFIYLYYKTNGYIQNGRGYSYRKTNVTRQY